MSFFNRSEAGAQLAGALIKYRGDKEAVVMGLARGGVVVAAEVAKALKLPLGVVIVRKLGAPHNPELAVGAISETGEGYFNESLIQSLGVSKEYLLQEVEKEKKIAQERKKLYFGEKRPPAHKDQTVILVDDGIATGASIRVAIRSLRVEGVKKIVLAVPVAAPESLESISKEVDETVCLSAPAAFYAVGQFYAAFPQTTDAEIVAMLQD